MRPTTLSIGEAARASGVSAKMIRYYESTGLVRPAKRTGGGYRTYTGIDVHELRFIRRARDLGFPIASIGELLSLWRNEERRSAEVKAIALVHIANLRTRIRELEAMVEPLENLVEACHGDSRPDCPILADLEDGRQEREHR